MPNPILPLFFLTLTLTLAVTITMNWITNKLFYRKFYNLRHLILKCVKCFKSFSFWIKEYLLPPPPSSPSLLNLLFYLPISFRLIFDSHFMPICARASIYNCGSLFFFFRIFTFLTRGWGGSSDPILGKCEFRQHIGRRPFSILEPRIVDPDPVGSGR